MDLAQFSKRSQSPGKLSQLITTTPGQAYNLSFALVDEVGQATDTFKTVKTRWVLPKPSPAIKRNYALHDRNVRGPCCGHHQRQHGVPELCRGKQHGRLESGRGVRHG